MRRVVALLVLGLGLAACGSREQVAVDGGYQAPPPCSPPAGGRCAGDIAWPGPVDLSADGLRLDGILLCGGSLHATEGPAVVTIRLHVGRLGPGSMTCARVPVGVTLHSPLGDRTVVDATTGRTVRVVRR